MFDLQIYNSESADSWAVTLSETKRLKKQIRDSSLRSWWHYSPPITPDLTHALYVFVK